METPQPLWATCVSVWSPCGGLTLAGHQVPTKAAPSLPSSAGQGRENTTKGSWVERGTGKSLSNCCHGQNRISLGKINLLPIKSESKLMRNKNKSKKHLSPTSWAQLHSWLLCLLPLPRGTGNGGYSQFITHCLCRSFLLSGRTHRITQNHRMFGVGKDLCGSSIQPSCRSRVTYENQIFFQLP